MKQRTTNKAICISELSKTYDNGFQALNNINLEIESGEIFALLGSNGAGKTTLISAICGLINFHSGAISVFGHDIIKNYRITRSHIGLVPQELTTDAFETVWNSVIFSRGVFGKPYSPSYIEHILKQLSLWDKKDSQIRTLSGGMKRRVMIAKALSHEPDILFLDEPSAGVDVALRQAMWDQVRALRDNGVTIFLTTHYIQEAEEMADRIGIIDQGKLILVEKKNSLMQKLGKKKLIINLHTPLSKIPKSLSIFDLQLDKNRKSLILTYDTTTTNTKIYDLLNHLKENDIQYQDIDTSQSSLEEIFVQLVKKS